MKFVYDGGVVVCYCGIVLDCDRVLGCLVYYWSVFERDYVFNDWLFISEGFLYTDFLILFFWEFFCSGGFRILAWLLLWVCFGIVDDIFLYMVDVIYYIMVYEILF